MKSWSLYCKPEYKTKLEQDDDHYPIPPPSTLKKREKKVAIAYNSHFKANCLHYCLAKKTRKKSLSTLSLLEFFKKKEIEWKKERIEAA